MHTETCCVCGVEFGLSDTVHELRRADGKKFYCSSGHAQHYGDSRLTTLEKRVAELEKEHRNQTVTLCWYTDTLVPHLYEEIEQLRAERRSARCSAASYRGHLMRIRAET